MKNNGHNYIDLLKIDIEGAEYKVIESIIKDNLDIHILCVEYDEAFNRIDNQAIKRIRESILKLYDSGWKIVNVCKRTNYTFVKINI